MELIEYKDLKWYIIKETYKDRLLFLDDSFTDKQIAKYFTDEKMVHECAVMFSKMNSPLFRDSYVREILNGPFLNDLDQNDLNVMETTVTLNDESVTTRDYVRLITREEAEKLPRGVRGSKSDYGYFTMTPYSWNVDEDARVFCVDRPNAYSYLYALNAQTVFAPFKYAVRPVISLKSDSFDQILEREEQEIKELINIIYVLQNNKISEVNWLKYLLKYNTLKNLDGSADFIVLRNLLGTSLMSAQLSLTNLSDLDQYIEFKRSIEESLGHSRKLIIN